MSIIRFASINSTNDYLKVKYPFLDDWSVVISDYQEKGKGRNKNVWESESKKNLLCSILIKDKKILKYASNLPLLTGACLYQLLSKLRVKNVKIKWPNDIYVNDKKICGILLESVSINDEIKAVVIGVGLNLNQTQFPSHLNATSYSLEKHKYAKIDKIQTLLVKLLKKETQKLILNKSKYLDIIKNNNYLLNKMGVISLNGKNENVIFLDINPDNTLKVKIHNEIISVNSGEVSIVK